MEADSHLSETKVPKPSCFVINHICSVQMMTETEHIHIWLHICPGIT